MLDTIEIETHVNPEASIIWMHGLGADAKDFESVVPELCLPKAFKVRFIFPNASIRPVTINNGLVCRAWYDIFGIGPHFPEDRKGLDESKQAIYQLIHKENSRGILTSKIMLAGFSQGGAVALYSGLRYSEPLAGILALSTYLPFAKELKDEIHQSNHHTPIFLAHGNVDYVVPMIVNEYTRHWLIHSQASVDSKIYSMGHGLCQPELQDITRFIQKCFS